MNGGARLKSDRIVKEAIELPALDRLQLVDHISASLDIPDNAIEELWAEEATRRWKAYKDGKIDSVSAAEAFEKYNR